MIANQFTAVAVGFHVFAITGETIAVAMVAFYALVPTVIVGIYGGALVDVYDRRTVSLYGSLGALAAVAAIAGFAWAGIEDLTPYYVLTTLASVAGTITNSARGAIIPRLIRRELLASAAAHRGISMGVASSLAPALAGLLIAAFGYPVAYSVNALVMAIGLLGVFSLPPIPPLEQLGRPGLGVVLEGLRFVRQATNIRTSFLLDIVSMVLAHPRALFPAVGVTVLGGGAMTAGILGAGVAVGSFVNSLLSGNVRFVRWQGRALVIATVGYGACIVAFGLLLVLASTVWRPQIGPDGMLEVNQVALALAFVILMAAGAADNLTTIYRSAIMQAAVPDQYRGRVQGVFSVVVTSGPRLGDMFVGLLTLVGALWLPPVAGGLLTVVFALSAIRLYRGFWRYDAHAPAARG
jgi:MFS family permease